MTALTKISETLGIVKDVLDMLLTLRDLFEMVPKIWMIWM